LGLHGQSTERRFDLFRLVDLFRLIDLVRSTQHIRATPLRTFSIPTIQGSDCLCRSEQDSNTSYLAVTLNT